MGAFFVLSIFQKKVSIVKNADCDLAKIHYLKT